MPGNSIIHDDYIDEKAAKDYLNDDYHGINLLPGVPQVLTALDAATVLGVSVPTIQRMIQHKEITLTRKSLLDYMFDNMLVNKPVAWPGNNGNPAQNTPK